MGSKKKIDWTRGSGIRRKNILPLFETESVDTNGQNLSSRLRLKLQLYST